MSVSRAARSVGPPRLEGQFQGPGSVPQAAPGGATLLTLPGRRAIGLLVCSPAEGRRLWLPNWDPSHRTDAHPGRGQCRV